MWIDPLEVSYRIGENGSICVLYEHKGSKKEESTDSTPEAWRPTTSNSTSSTANVVVSKPSGKYYWYPLFLRWHRKKNLWSIKHQNTNILWSFQVLDRVIILLIMVTNKGEPHLLYHLRSNWKQLNHHKQQLRHQASPLPPLPFITINLTTTTITTTNLSNKGKKNGYCSLLSHQF